MNRTVVVVGGGYAGSMVAQALDAEAEVVLIDPREAFVNAAASLRALTRPDWAHHAFFPFGTLLERGQVIRDRAISVDPKGVLLASGERVEADYLVLATGSSYPYPAKPRPASSSVADQLHDLRQTHQELAGADRVLIVGAGPVGLELAGEITEVWPGKQVSVVDRSDQVLPGFLPEIQDDLRRQLGELGVDLRLGTGLSTMPGTEAGRLGTFTVTTDRGDEIVADLWFRAHGVRLNTDYLADGCLTALTERAAVPVTGRLNVPGHDHVYAVGDITELPDPKMASYAMTQAEVVVSNLKAQLAGRLPNAEYAPAAERRILLPLGTRGGVGQLPAPEGAVAATLETVYQRKGADLFTARFAERFRA